MSIFVPFSPFQFKYLGVHNINLTKKYKIADNIICWKMNWLLIIEWFQKLQEVCMLLINGLILYFDGKFSKFDKKEKWEKFNVKRTLVTDKSMKKSRYKQPLDLYAKSLLPNENLSSAYKFWRSVNPYVSSFFRIFGQKKLKFSRANFMHGSGILHHRAKAVKNI